MNELQLEHFRTLASILEKRQKVEMEIHLSTGRVLSGLFDPLFKTITVGNATFPETEINTWVRLFYGARVTMISNPARP